MTHAHAGTLRAGVILFAGALLSACAVRHVVLEPESPVDRLSGRVIADVVTPTVSASQPVLLARIHAVAPKDSAILMAIRSSALPARAGGMHVVPQLLHAATKCDDRSPRIEFMAVCKPGGGENLHSESELVRVRVRRQFFGVDRPDSLITVPDTVVRVPAGRDTVFFVATRVMDPDLDLSGTRYGVQLTWYTVPTTSTDADHGVRRRGVYLRASFRTVAYHLVPAWFGAAIAVVWLSTFK